MAALRHRGVEIDICGACGGVWLDLGEWEKIVQSKSNHSTSGWDAVADTGFEIAGEVVGEAVSLAVQFVAEALSGL